MRRHQRSALTLPTSSCSNCAVGGFSIPTCTTVFVNAWAIHRDPCFWGKDAGEFKPERWLEAAKEKSSFSFGGNEFCYMPFGAGRRMCVGVAMGEKMVVYILASLLHSFDWQLPEGKSLDLQERFGTVLRKTEQLFAVPAVRLDKTELYSSLRCRR
ncbi:cytochrome P450 750A1-like [Phalaenopsis equestris]|uniref:cytochrome P450 750A1-like n=1 Tax=Phalaenopsis equestris TaxID=78828 RepID=UPI0009E2C26E|nr:cytochrome P450 750A1-like [Phalaenopsis equestris]